eukprot:1142219-Pelagomonas_calceolata.AAC.1
MKICSQKYECCYSVYGGLNDNNNRMSLNAAYKQDSNKFLDVHTLVQLLGALSCQQLQLVYTLVVTNTSKSERHIQLLPHLYSSYTSGYSQRLIKHVSGLTCFPGSNAGKVIDQSFQTLVPMHALSAASLIATCMCSFTLGSLMPTTCTRSSAVHLSATCQKIQGTSGGGFAGRAAEESRRRR